MRRSILILIFLFSALPAGAKDFYIAAKQAGTGSGTGCSTAKPYTWFNTASSWGTAASQIGPATTVHLCGTFVGAPGQRLLIVGGNGNSTSPITIKFETNAVLAAPYWSSIGAIVLNRDSDGVTAVEWNGQVFTRRSPSNRYDGAVWYSRHLGKDSDGNMRYARLISFRALSDAEPIAAKAKKAIRA